MFGDFLNIKWISNGKIVNENIFFRNQQVNWSGLIHQKSLGIQQKFVEKFTLWLLQLNFGRFFILKCCKIRFFPQMFPFSSSIFAVLWISSERRKINIKMQRWFETYNSDGIESPSNQGKTAAPKLDVNGRLHIFRVLVNQNLDPNERVAVTGECSSLGNWLPAHCVQLIRENGEP